MKLSLTLLALAVGLVYGILKTWLPDFPIDENTLLAFLVYILGKLGIEIVEPALRRFLVKKGFTGFDPYF